LRNELLLIDLDCEALMSDIICRCRTHRLSTAVRVVYNLSVNFLKFCAIWRNNYCLIVS